MINWRYNYCSMFMRTVIVSILSLQVSLGYAAVPAIAPQERFTWAALGVAYAFLICSLLVAGIQYLYCRWQWVLTPTSSTRRYCIALMIITAFYIILTIMENGLAQLPVAPLPYESVPQALLILFVHYVAYRNEQPASITLAINLVVATGLVGLAASLVLNADIGLVHWAAGLASLVLVIVTLYRSSASKKSFTTGKYFLESESEPNAHGRNVSTRWLSMGNWVLMVAASIAMAVAAQMATGATAGNLLAADILVDSLIVLGTTLLIAGVPTGLYWLVHRQCLPDLTWTAWVVWACGAAGLVYLRYLTAA